MEEYQKFFRIYYSHTREKGDDFISENTSLPNEEDADGLFSSIPDDIFREEMYFKYVWSKFPSNVLAERDDSVVKALCYGPGEEQEPT